MSEYSAPIIRTREHARVLGFTIALFILPDKIRYSAIDRCLNIFGLSLFEV
jgi:hypothetical protein